MYVIMDDYEICEANVSEENLISDFQSSVIPLMVVTGLLCVTGIIGNLIVLHVHLFKYKKCNFRIFVLYLCVFDLMSCCILIPLQMYGQYKHFNQENRVQCRAESFLNIATSMGNIYGLLLIAFDRYRKVCHPHEWQMKRKSVGVCLFISVFVAFIFASPVIWLWNSNTDQLQYKGCTVNVIRCKADQDDFLPTLYLVCLAPNFLVLVVVLVMYGFVFRQLSKSEAAAKSRETRIAMVSQAPRASGVFPIANQNLPQNTLSPWLGHSTTNTSDANEWYATDDDDGDDEDDDVDSQSNAKVKRNAPRRMGTFVDHERKHSKISNLRRVTVLTFIFTVIFFITALMYFAVGLKDSNEIPFAEIHIGETIFFKFLFRFYYINFTMHPILYGFFDPNFKKAVRKIPVQISASMRRKFSATHLT